MNADPLARHYRSLEHLVYGRALERCRTALLPRLDPPPAKALFIGEGDGRFLEAFLQRFPHTDVEIVESSAAMIELASRRTSNPRVRFRHGDVLAQDFAASARYDLVVTHFFIDVLTEHQLQTLVERLRIAAPGASWLLSEFQVCPRSSTLAHYLSRSVIAVMYAFFRLTTGLTTSSIPDFRTIFTRSGLTLQTRTSMLGGFLTSELWKLP